jgi:hypothetical protein
MFDSINKFRVFTRAIIISCVLLVLILSGFQAIALSSYSSDQTNTIQQQGAISQRIAKNVLLMAYMPSRKVNAVNELQNVLPNFEAGQKVIPLLPATAQNILIETNPDYQDIDTAVKKILSTPDKPVDPLQAQIILDHERAYYLSISQAVAALKTNTNSHKTGLLMIELFIDVLLLIIGISFLIIVERLIKRYEEIERAKKESEHVADANQQSL